MKPFLLLCLPLIASAQIKPLFLGNRIIVGDDNGLDLYEVTPA